MTFTDEINPPTAGTAGTTPPPPNDANDADDDSIPTTADQPTASPPVTPSPPSTNLVDLEALSFEQYPLTKPQTLSSVAYKSRKWHVFLLPNLPGPKDKYELDSSFSSFPVDWCDAFSLPFHIHSETDLTVWKSMLDNLSRVKNSSDFFESLTLRFRQSPLCFLTVDRKGNPTIIHNIVVDPASGSFQNPDPVFFAQSRTSFQWHPVLLECSDLDASLKSINMTGVPTMTDILNGCAEYTGIALKPCHRWKLDPDLFRSLQGSPTSSKIDLKFSSTGLVLISPGAVGHLLDFLEHVNYDPKIATPSMIASVLFRNIFTRFCLEKDRTPDEIDKGIPDDHPLILRYSDLFRFLWAIHNKKTDKLTLFTSQPQSLETSNRIFQNHRSSIFPITIADNSTGTTTTAQSTFAVSNALASPSQQSQNTNSSQGHSSSSSTNKDQMITYIDSLGNQVSVPASLYFVTNSIGEMMKQQNKVLSSSVDDKNNYKTLPHYIQKNLLYAQFKDGDTSLPTDLTEACRDLWKIKNTAMFHQMLHNHVFRDNDDICQLPIGQAGNMQRYGLKWRWDEKPSGCSPFAFDPKLIPGSLASQSNAAQESIYHETLAAQNGFHSKTEMREIYKEADLHPPLSIDDYRIQLRTFWLLYARLFGEQCIIAQSLLKMNEHFIRWRRRYTANHEDDFRFLSQSLFSIDQAIQSFITQYLDNPIDAASINSAKINWQLDTLCSAIETRQPLARLPTFAMDAIRALRDSSPKENKLKRQTPQQSGGSNNINIPEIDPNKRTRIDPTTFSSPANWKLSDPSRYRSVFKPETLRKMPSITKNGRPSSFCNRLFATGSCREGSKCNFTHDDPSRHGKKAEMDSFYASAYATRPSTTGQSSPGTTTVPGQE
jgi:hypothetical protein